MSKHFTRPDQKQQRLAVGPLTNEPEQTQKAFSTFNLHFSPIPLPTSSDWLGCHTEKGQSFSQFRTTCKPPTKSKKNFYIQPLNHNLPSQTLSLLLNFAQAFFPKQVSFTLLDPIDLPSLKIKQRINSGITQYNAAAILKKLQKGLNINAYAMIGVMLDDIYHNEQNNFVFGLGSGASKTGVFSFARYDEAFYGNAENLGLLEYRAVKVMIHEMCHMFGMAHCVYFHCLMNGSNHIDETDAKPFWLCPVCARKVCFTLGLEVGEWYSGVLGVIQRAGSFFEPAGQWYTERLRYLAG